MKGKQKQQHDGGDRGKEQNADEQEQ